MPAEGDIVRDGEPDRDAEAVSDGVSESDKEVEADRDRDCEADCDGDTEIDADNESDVEGDPDREAVLVDDGVVEPDGVALGLLVGVIDLDKLLVAVVEMVGVREELEETVDVGDREAPLENEAEAVGEVEEVTVAVGLVLLVQERLGAGLREPVAVVEPVCEALGLVHTASATRVQLVATRRPAHSWHGVHPREPAMELNVPARHAVHAHDELAPTRLP